MAACKGSSVFLTRLTIHSVSTDSLSVTGCFALPRIGPVAFEVGLGAGAGAEGISPPLPTRTRVEPSVMPYDEMVKEGSLSTAPL